MEANQLIEAVTWVGRQQAFAVIASKCTAAQAQCLSQIRETRAHEQLGLSWDEFCSRNAGITRRYADDLIHRLDEFGESYFKLAQLARISPETYRQIAGQVYDNIIELDGEELELVPENAALIRAGIQRLQKRLRHQREPTAPATHSVVELQARLESLMADFAEFAEQQLPAPELAALRGMCSYAINKWRVLARAIDDVRQS